MEYPPPSSLVYAGIQFNPALFEIDAVDNVFSQATIATLNTDNIQGINPADNITLYTLTSGILTLGASILAQLKIYSTWVQIFTPVYYVYNPASTQLWSTRFYTASNAITTLFFADTTSTQPSVSLQSKPTTVGDTTGLNGWYSMAAGTISMGCQIKTSLEAPLHYLYNYAKTMYKQTSYGATSIIETYYADPVNPTVASATINLNTYGSLITNGCDYIINSGIFKSAASRWVEFNADIHYFYTFARTAYKVVGYGASYIYMDDHADITNTGTVTTSVGSIVLTAGTATNNDGQFYVLARDIKLNASTSIKACAPIIPDYIPVYSATHGVNVVGAIGYTYTGVQSIAPLTLLTSGSQPNYFTALTSIPAGVWLVSAACRYDIILATNISRQFLTFATGLTPSFYQNIIISSTTGTSPTLSITQLAFTCVINATADWSCGCSFSLTFSVAGAIQIPTAGTNTTSYFRITRIA